MTTRSRSAPWADPRGLLDAVTRLALAGLVAATLARLLAGAWWGFELWSHFPVPGVVASVVLAVMLVGLTRRRLALVALAVGFPHGLALAGEGLALARGTAAPLARPAGSVRVVFLNVRVERRDRAATLRVLLAADADVIAVAELDRTAHEGLAALGESHPYHRLVVRPDTYGIGIWSRLPLEEVRVVPSSDRRIPTLVAVIGPEASRFTLVVTHPPPPITAGWAHSRDEQLASVGWLVAELPPPVLLVGDLNCTPWSPAFARVTEPAGLVDTRLGRGLQGSWPVALPGALRLPIDHALATPGLVILRRELLPACGSDHRPVLVDIFK